MKKTIFYLTLMIIMLMFIPNCKSAFVWNPVGNWTWTITGSWSATPWNETLTFNGTESGGLVNGWYYCSSGSPGTWTKTGDFTVTITFDFPYDNDLDHLEFTGTSSEANSNSMSGTGTWYFYLNGSLEDTWTMTFNGTKTSNLQ
jgi:hypothetical protein